MREKGVLRQVDRALLTVRFPQSLLKFCLFSTAKAYNYGHALWPRSACRLFAHLDFVREQTDF